MGTDHTDLAALAQEYLDACVAALNTVPAGAPDRRFLSAGPPAWDCCPQLSVHVVTPVVAETSAGPGALAGGHRITVSGQVNLVDMVATIIRCVPTVTEDALPPAAADLTASARETYSDVWALWNTLSEMKRQKTLFQTGCAREVYLLPGVALVAEGGCSGWAIGVRVQLDGYRP